MKKYWCLALSILIFAYFLQCNKTTGRETSGPTSGLKKRLQFYRAGDSVANGYGASKGNATYELLAKELKGKYPEVELLQISADLSISKEHVLQFEKIKKQPKDVFGIFIFSTYGNDLGSPYLLRSNTDKNAPPRDGQLYGITLQQAKSKFGPILSNRLRHIHQLLEERFPGGFHVFLFTVFDPTDGVVKPELIPTPRSGGTKKFPAWPDLSKVIQYSNSLMKKFANESANVTLVDVHKVMLNHGLSIVMDNPQQVIAQTNENFWYIPALEDPNDYGYKAIFDSMKTPFLNTIHQRLLVH